MHCANKVSKTLACAEKDSRSHERTIESLSGRTCELHPKPQAGGAARRMVHFGLVRIREYGVTVGAYAAANDMQLTWEYSPCETCLGVEEHETRMSEDGWSSKSLQRLSPSARRARIARVQGTTHSAIACLEFDLVLELIRETSKSIDGNIRHCQNNHGHASLAE
jgi:hypothetical protein